MAKRDLIKNLLILTSSGGSGHLQAAKAMAHKVRKEDPGACITEIDIMYDLLGRKLGRFFVFLWNRAQAQGDVKKQKLLSDLSVYEDILFYLPIFFKTVCLLMKKKIDHVIDTQPNFTSAIIKAVKCVEFLQKRKIRIEKLITELPTNQCSHFFHPIKNLNKKDRQLINLLCTKPLLGENQTADAFWRQNCGLSEGRVYYHELPLRPTFEKFQDRIDAHEPINLPIKVHGHEEKNLILTTIKRGPIKATPDVDTINLTIDPKDRVFTLMLGSIPAECATLHYIKQFIKILKELGCSKTPYHLFVFCNDHKPGAKSLLKKVHDLTASMANLPKNLTVIPMSFQSDEVIAPLFYRSEATFTRSGGLTSMELMAVAKGQICIHSEAKNPGSEEPGMPDWEYGNAFYLQKKRGALIINRESFTTSCRSLFLLA